MTTDECEQSVDMDITADHAAQMTTSLFHPNEEVTMEEEVTMDIETCEFNIADPPRFAVPVAGSLFPDLQTAADLSCSNMWEEPELTVEVVRSEQPKLSLLTEEPSKEVSSSSYSQQMSTATTSSQSPSNMIKLESRPIDSMRCVCARMPLYHLNSKLIPHLLVDYILIDWDQNGNRKN